MLKEIVHYFKVRRWTRLYWKHDALYRAADARGDKDKALTHMGKAALYLTRAVLR